MTVEDIGYGREFDGWYDRIFRKDESADMLAQFLANQHPDPAQGTLELGVGTGRIAIPLSKLIGPITGVDSSTEMLAQLRQEVDEDRVAPVLGDVRTYEDDRTYGLVYCICSTLSLVLDPADQQRAVQRAADRVAPGGRLVLETHNRPAMHALHEGMTRATTFFPYPDRNTGLQTHATMLPDNLWHCTQIWYEADGTHQIGNEILRLLTPDDTDVFATAAGLKPESRWADPLGNEYSENSPMFITVYTKQ